MHTARTYPPMLGPPSHVHLDLASSFVFCLLLPSSSPSPPCRYKPATHPPQVQHRLWGPRPLGVPVESSHASHKKSFPTSRYRCIWAGRGSILHIEVVGMIQSQTTSVDADQGADADAQGADQYLYINFIPRLVVSTVPLTAPLLTNRTNCNNSGEGLHTHTSAHAGIPASTLAPKHRNHHCGEANWTAVGQADY